MEKIETNIRLELASIFRDLSKHSEGYLSTNDASRLIENLISLFNKVTTQSTDNGFRECFQMLEYMFKYESATVKEATEYAFGDVRGNTLWEKLTIMEPDAIRDRYHMFVGYMTGELLEVGAIVDFEGTKYLVVEISREDKEVKLWNPNESEIIEASIYDIEETGKSIDSNMDMVLVSKRKDE